MSTFLTGERDLLGSVGFLEVNKMGALAYVVR